MSKEKRTKLKILFVFALFVFCGIGIITKLYFLQITDHKRLDNKAESQYQAKFYEYTNRGNIYDRNMRELAVNVKVKSVYANPKEIVDPWRTAEVVSSVLDLSKREIRKKLKQKRAFVYLKRKISPDAYEKLKDKKLPGIHFKTEYKRFYPKKELAARTIGFAGIDNQGLSGIEYAFDSFLSQGGKWIHYDKDRRGRSLALNWNDSERSQKGSDVVLTIDEVIQYHAYKAVREKVINSGARRGIAIVMKPDTGEVLAMVDYPSYNANLYQEYSTGKTKNQAISNSFEPGSTFKLILASAALEEKIAQPKDIFFCENGALDIGGIVIHEANRKKFRWLTLTEIISKSSNIGAVKIGQRLGEARFYELIQRFGFGKKTGIDLPGEATGIVRDPSDWSKLSIGSISMGQEISTTPLQLITAVSAIANGGHLMKPMIVKEVIHEGKIIKAFLPDKIRKVVSVDTVEAIKKILAHTVEYGTGKKAAIPGYTVGGKTGTAQKFDKATNRYSRKNYLASFVGFVPVEKPKLAILVMIDEPRGVYWGGSVAAPVFKEIAMNSLRHMNVPSKMNRIYALQAKSIEEGRTKFDADMQLKSVRNNNSSKIKNNLNESLDKVLTALKKHYWESDEGSKQSQS